MEDFLYGMEKEWKKIASMECGKIVFHSIPYHALIVAHLYDPHSSSAYINGLDQNDDSYRCSIHQTQKFQKDHHHYKKKLRIQLKNSNQYKISTKIWNKIVTAAVQSNAAQWSVMTMNREFPPSMRP